MFPLAGSRVGRGANNAAPSLQSGRVLYAGTGGNITYDPGVAGVTLDQCSIAIPAAPFPRIFEVTALWGGSTGFTHTHGVRNDISLDGTLYSADAQGWTESNGTTETFMTLGPMVVIVPGDGLPHTIALQVSDSGATGNLLFGQRWIVAERIG